MSSVAGRRVAKLEGALHPREAVLAWLAEAQQYPSFVDVARAIADRPVEAAPVSVIAARVMAAVRAERKGQPRAAIERAALRAEGDTVFLFCLVIVLNGRAFEVAEREGLRAACAFFWMGALLGGPGDPPTSNDAASERAEAWRTWRTLVDRLGADVRVEAGARSSLEGRYLGGHDILFADASADWARHAELVTRLGGLATGMPGAGPAGTAKHTRDEAARVEALAARLADDARVKAYEIIGERERAVPIMERRLRE